MQDLPNRPETRPEVRRYVHLVRIVAGRIAARLPSGIDMEDLIGAGMLGLLGAAGQYDESRGVPFARYAEVRIRGAILDELRAMDPTSRTARSRAEEIRFKACELANALGRTPSAEEVADALGVSVQAYQEMQLQATPRVVVSLNQPGYDEDGPEIGDLLPDENAEMPDELRMASETAGSLLGAVSGLTARQRHVVKLHYLEGLSFREVSELLEITEGRISQLHTAAMEHLQGHVDRPGV